jgi:hypothetical protein
MAERLGMARIFKMWVELHEPSAQRPLICLESFEQVRTASPNRILHFGYPEHLEENDVDYLVDVITAQLRALIGRTVGTQGKLTF